MSDGWIDAYLDHYAKFLPEPVQARPYSVSDELPPIRILEYDNVIDGCRVFATLGLSDYFASANVGVEVICPVDEGWDRIPEILSSLLFRFVASDGVKAPERGSAIGGVDEVAADFAKKYRKTALYLTDPYGLPEEFAFVERGSDEGRVYLAMFLSKKEFEFLGSHDCEALEDRFEIKAVDPYDLSRKSCV